MPTVHPIVSLGVPGHVQCPTHCPVGCPLVMPTVQLIVLWSVPWSCQMSNSLSCGASPGHAHCPTDCLVGRPWARPVSNSLSCGASPWHARCPTHCLVGRPLAMREVQLIVACNGPYVHNIRCCINAIPYLEDQPQRLIGRLGGGGRGPRHIGTGGPRPLARVNNWTKELKRTH